MNDKSQKPGLFRIPIFAWCVFALFWSLAFGIILFGSSRIELVDGFVIGRVFGEMVTQLGFAYVLALFVYRMSRRSQRVASIVYVVFLIGVMALQVGNFRNDIQTYLETENLEDKPPETKESLKLACDNGSSLGCHKLAVFYVKEGKREKAKELFKLACDKENASSCTRLASLYYEEKNLVEAKRFAQLACDKGNANSCYNAGTIYAKEGNVVEAKKLYKLACDKESPLGCHKLAVFYVKEGKREKAKELFKLACDKENASSCTRLASLYYE